MPIYDSMRFAVSRIPSDRRSDPPFSIAQNARRTMSLTNRKSPLEERQNESEKLVRNKVDGNEIIIASWASRWNPTMEPLRILLVMTSNSVGESQRNEYAANTAARFTSTEACSRTKLRLINWQEVSRRAKWNEEKIENEIPLKVVSNCHLEQWMLRNTPCIIHRKAVGENEHEKMCPYLSSIKKSLIIHTNSFGRSLSPSRFYVFALGRCFPV